MANRPPSERPASGQSMETLQSPYKRPRPHSPQHRDVHRGYHLYVTPGSHEPATSYSMSGSQYAAGIYAHPAAGEHVRHQGIPGVEFRDHREPQYGSPPNSQANIRRRPSLLSEFHPTDRDRGPEYYRQPSFEPLRAVSSQADSDVLAPKRPRLTMEVKSEVDAKSLRRPMMMGSDQRVAQPVSQPEIKKEPFIPKVENVSPTPCDDQESPSKLSKEGLLQSMERVDREIAKVESQITKLKKKQQELEERAAKPPEPEKPSSPETSSTEPKQQNTVQIIYAENRRKAEEAHNMLLNLGPKYDLPVYNQPSDSSQYQENIKTNVEMRKRLILFFKKRNEAKKKRERFLCQRYDQLMEVWEKRMERLENNPKRKAKDAKVREFFEKQFSEIRKQREQQERFSRAGTRSSWGNIARSDAELAEIVDGLNEQEANERHIRSLAVVPPMLFDSTQRKIKFINKNGLIEDPMKEHKESLRMNLWTEEEKEIFREKYLLHPKNFQLIASFLERKGVADCVLYYYHTKKNENYKQTLRKTQVKRRRGFPAKTTTPINRNQDDDDKDGGKEDDSSNQGPSSNRENTPSKPAGEDKVKEEDVGNDGNTGGNAAESPTTCSLCKNPLDTYSLSRPVNKTNCDMFGVNENEVTPNMRVCSRCRCRSIRRRCPVPSCKTPRRRVKRLKPLPAKWSEIPEDQRVTISEELGITEEITKCCAACFNRIARKLGTEGDGEEEVVSTPAQDSNDQATSETSRWTEEEMDVARNGLRQHGRDFALIAKMVGTKSEAQCKNFYFNYKRKFNLEQLLNDRKEKQAAREHKVSTTESTTSTLTAASDDEEMISSDGDDGDADNDVSTDTASSDNEEDTKKSMKVKTEGKDTPAAQSTAAAVVTSVSTSATATSSAGTSAAPITTSAVTTLTTATVAESSSVEVKKEVKKEVEQKPDVAKLQQLGQPNAQEGVNSDMKSVKLDSAMGRNTPIKIEPIQQPSPAPPVVIKKEELNLPDASTVKQRDDDDSSATDSADEDHHHQDMVLNDATGDSFASSSQQPPRTLQGASPNFAAGDKVSSSDEKRYFAGGNTMDSNARSKELPPGAMSSSQQLAMVKTEAKDACPAGKRDNSPESSSSRNITLAEYLGRPGQKGVNNIRDLIDSAIDKHLGKAHSPSSSQRESASSTPSISGPEPSKSPAASAASNKDTKESMEESKHPDGHYGDHARRTPPRADSSDSPAKARPVSRTEASSPYISAHIAHTSQVQQQQQQRASQQDIYEIGSTHPERYPPYVPGVGRQPAGYPGQRHPMEHPHGMHRESDPYAAERERERPGVSSPPGLSSSSSSRAGFQARAGSPFALVPAGMPQQLQQSRQLPRTTKSSNVPPPPPLINKASPKPMKAEKPLPLAGQSHHTGSITQGTPVNFTTATTSPTSRYDSHPSRPSSSPYEGLIKAQPPMSSPRQEGSSVGSITQGTPVIRREPTPVGRGTPLPAHTSEGSITRGTPINHESQRVTPSSYESAVARPSVSMYEGASIMHGTPMRHDSQMVRPPHPYDVRGIVYDQHALTRAAYERHGGSPMDVNVATLLMARHMAQYGEYNPMIRGQCDTTAFSTSKETIAGDFATAKQMSSGRGATIASDYATAKQMNQRSPYPQVSTPNLKDSRMSPRHESPLNKRYSPSAPHKPAHILDGLPPHMQVLPYGAPIPPQGGIMYLPSHGPVFIQGHGQATAAAAAAAAAAHQFQAPHLMHTPYTTAPVTRGSPHPPLSPHYTQAHHSPHNVPERPHQQPSPFQRESSSPADYAAAAQQAAQQAAAQQAAAQQAAAAAGLSRQWAGMPPHPTLRFKHPPQVSSPNLGLGLPIGPSSSAGSILRGTPMRPPPSITTGVPNPELRGEGSGRQKADSSSGASNSKSPGNPSSGSEAFAALVDVATKADALTVREKAGELARQMQQRLEENRPMDPNHPREGMYARPSHQESSQERRVSTSSDDKSREPPRQQQPPMKDGRPNDPGGNPSTSDRPPQRPPQHGDNQSRGRPDKARQEVMQQDASAIFAALFEKDTTKAKSGAGSESETAARPTLTAASLIDVIITRSINQPLLEAQDQGTDSDSNDFQPSRQSGSQELPSRSNQEPEQVHKDKEPVGMASSSTGNGSPNKPSAAPMPARSEKEPANPGNGSKPTQSNSGTPVKSSRPITLAEHIDSIISLDYNHSMQVGSSTSKSGGRPQEGATSGEAASVDTTGRLQQEQGPTSTMSATMRYHQKMSQESEVGSTNDANSRRENSPMSMSNVHSPRTGSAEARSRSRAGTPGSSGSPDTGNAEDRQRDDKGSSNRGTSSTSTRQPDAGVQSRSPVDAKPDSHSNGSGVNRWAPQFDRTLVSAVGSNPLRNPAAEASREASPISHSDLPTWSRKYPHDSSKADSSESPSAGSLSRVHVHSSQSNSPQASEGWGLDSSRPASLGRRRDSPETSTGLGSSSSMHPDASSSGLSAEGKKNYDSAAVSGGIADNKWRHGVTLADRSRPGMPEVESSRSSPIPQSSSATDYQSKGSKQPADSMSQMRQRMGATSSSRSPIAGQSNALSSSSSGMPPRGMPRGKDTIISLDLRKSIDRMIESQVRVDEPSCRPTQVRVDDYVTQLFEADMSSTMSTPQSCDSRESTSTAESGPGLQVDDNKISNVSDADSRQEPVSEGLQTTQRSHGGSPRQSSTETAETESPPHTPPVSASDAAAPSHSNPQDQRSRSTNAVSSPSSRRPDEQGSQPSQSLLPSSSQQGFPSGPQYPYSALAFPYASSTAAIGHHLANPQRSIPSPRAPGRGPSPAPGPGAAGREGKETTQILSSQYETLSDDD